MLSMGFVKMNTTIDATASAIRNVVMSNVLIIVHLRDVSAIGCQLSAISSFSLHCCTVLGRKESSHLGEDIFTIGTPPPCILRLAETRSLCVDKGEPRTKNT